MQENGENGRPRIGNQEPTGWGLVVDDTVELFFHDMVQDNFAAEVLVKRLDLLIDKKEKVVILLDLLMHKNSNAVLI